MKLNNKGFAFSTMLYGILTMMILTLMLIFGLMKYFKDESYYYSSEVEYNLNNCVFEEIALENCYSSGGVCDPTAYYSCMGLDTDEYILETTLASIIREKAVTTGDGLYIDDYSEGRYVFRGNSVNNYIKYSGLDWRIVSVEVDGSMKLMYPGYTEKLAWDVDGYDEWKDSSLNNYLMNDFSLKIADSSGFLQNVGWNVGWVYDTYNKHVGGNCSSNDPLESTSIICEEKYSVFLGSKKGEGIIGLLNVSDYYNASSNDTCRNDAFGGHSCTNWLSSYPTWLINPKGDATVTNVPADHAYCIDASGNVTTSSLYDALNVVPVVYLDSMIYVSGDGTLGNPYTVKQ